MVLALFMIIDSGSSSESECTASAQHQQTCCSCYGLLLVVFGSTSCSSLLILRLEGLLQSCTWSLCGAGGGGGGGGAAVTAWPLNCWEATLAAAAATGDALLAPSTIRHHAAATARLLHGTQVAAATDRAVAGWNALPRPKASADMLLLLLLRLGPCSVGKHLL